MGYDIARKGSEGNNRLLKQYGGSEKHSDRAKYADGGTVKAGGNPSLNEGLSAAGGAAKPNLARGGRKAPGKAGKGDKKGGTNVNVLIMPKPDAAAGAAPKPDAPAPAPMAGPAAPPPMPMPMPPPGAGPGGPPMPMRKDGGRVEKDEAKAAVHKHEKAKHKGEPMTKLSVGGPAKPPKGFDAGAGGAKGRLEKAAKYGK